MTLISREDAMGAVQDHFNAHGFKGYYDGQQMMDRINALPSAETDGWIPCSERLPSDSEHVIVSVLDDHGDTPWKYTTVAWLCNGVWISDNDILYDTAVAWKPLPMPYREESEVEE